MILGAPAQGHREGKGRKKEKGGGGKGRRSFLPPSCFLPGRDAIVSDYMLIHRMAGALAIVVSCPSRACPLPPPPLL